MVRRLVAPNASPFTFNGTCTYIVGQGAGRDRRSGPRRRCASLRAARRGRRRAGRDHSRHPYPSRSRRRRSNKLRRRRARRWSAPRRSRPAAMARPASIPAHDRDYSPDAILADGERWQGAGYTIEAVATPGHCSNHLCFALLEENALFSGDHVMALVDVGCRAARRFDARLYGLARQAARARRDDLLARPRRPRRRTATLSARADPSPAPAGSLDPERAWRWPADDSGARRQGLCRPEPVLDAGRGPLDPCPSRGFERARAGDSRGEDGAEQRFRLA